MRACLWVSPIHCHNQRSTTKYFNKISFREAILKTHNNNKKKKEDDARWKTQNRQGCSRLNHISL